MRRLALLTLLPAILGADDRWVKFTSGPFEVMTDAGPRVGRETMVEFLQFRHAVGQIVGEPEADAKKGRISITSPIARALINKKKGENVEVNTPGGAKAYAIKKIEWK